MAFPLAALLSGRSLFRAVLFRCNGTQNHSVMHQRVPFTPYEILQALSELASSLRLPGDGKPLPQAIRHQRKPVERASQAK